MADSLKIVDVVRYEKYTDDLKAYFDGMQKSVMALIPDMDSMDNGLSQTDKSRMKEASMLMAENFAFDATDTFQKAVEDKVKSELEKYNLLNIESMLTEIKNSISQLQNSATAGAGSETTM